MKSPQFYASPPIIDEDGEISTDVHNPTRIDLQTAPWKTAAALIISAKTTNTDAAGVNIPVEYAFSQEEFPAADAPTRLAGRKAALNANVGAPAGGILEYASARVPITGRYLYVWWSAAANDGGDIHMTVHALPVD